MATSRRAALRFVSPLALMIASLGAVSFACYKPSIADGKLRCNPDAGAAHACPEGFKCEVSTQLCKMHPNNDASPEVMTDAGDGGGVVDAIDAEVSCFQPDPTCTPSTAGLCDPACQSGCGCREKCSINTNGALTCNAPRMQGFPRGLMQDCTIESGGSGAQTDNCGPGLVCIEDGCFARCFQFCKKDGDCTNSTCTRDTVGADGGATGQKVCDVPFVDSCIPLMGSQNMGCGTVGAMSCYLSSTNPTHTICDCPQGASGPNGPCARSRECNRGLACVQLPNGLPPQCLQVCRLHVDGGNDCAPLGQVCNPYVGIPRGTAANADFGYCY